MDEYRWEYSPLARLGNLTWVYCINRPLMFFAEQDLDMLRRTRGVIQIAILVAIVLLPLSYFYSPAHLITASGLLFDIAGALRLFLLEEVTEIMAGAEENAAGNLPSVYMREFVMPEGSGPYDAQSPHMSFFYYKKRGVFFLIIGFVLQFVGDIIG